MFSGSSQNSFPQQIEVASSVHLPSDEFQFGDLALSLALAPRKLYTSDHSIQTLKELGDESLDFRYAAFLGIPGQFFQILVLLTSDNSSKPFEKVQSRA